MSIKLVAVDMDGTFLTHDKTYDRESFHRFFEYFHQKNGHFAVASGNQYYQLKSFFEEYGDKISYIAENGAWIMSEGKELYCGVIDPKTVRDVLTELQKYRQIKIVVCGKNSAYVLEKDGLVFYEQIHRYYHKLKRVKNFEEGIVRDHILKLALMCPFDETNELMSQLSLPDHIVPTSGGQGCIDLIIKGQNKGNALLKLCHDLDISLDECIAFGDGGNDVEMLSMAGCGYAVANAGEEAKQAADKMIDSNENQGVIKELLRLMEKAIL